MAARTTTKRRSTRKAPARNARTAKPSPAPVKAAPKPEPVKVVVPEPEKAPVERAARLLPVQERAIRLAQAVENSLQVSQQLSADAPVWARSVTCPKCESTMAMMKRRTNTEDHGENIGYHCPACFLWMQITEAVHFNLVPTTDQSRIGWQGLDRAEKPTAAAVAAKAVKSFTTVPKAPPSPVQNNVVWKIIWDHFWDSMISGRPLSPQGLIDFGASKKGDTPRLRELVKTLPTWTAHRTGYVVKVKDGNYVIAGKTTGDKTLPPFSDPNYRKVHQFQ